MKKEINELVEIIMRDRELREEHGELAQSLTEVDGQIAEMAKAKSPKNFDDADRRAFATLRDRRELVPLRQQRIDEELMADEERAGAVLVRLKAAAGRTHAQFSKEVEAGIAGALSKYFSKQEATRIAAENVGKSNDPRLVAAHQFYGMLWRIKTDGQAYDEASRIEIAKTVVEFAKANKLAT